MQSLKMLRVRATRIAILIAILFLVPAIAWTGSLYLESSWNSDLRKLLSEQGELSRQTIDEKISSLPRKCEQGSLLDQANFTDALCGDLRQIRAIRFASALTAALGVALIAVVFLARAIASNNRHRLSLVFSPLLRVLFFFLGTSVIGQGVSLVYVAYAVEVTAFRLVHGGSLLIISFGAIAGCATLLKSAVGVFRIKPLLVSALRLDPQGAEGIFQLASATAQRVKSPVPDNIIVCLEPQFFVTKIPVKLTAERDMVLTGTTLCLSLAMLHVFSRKELAAVIGHELGHFRNEDLEYSVKFQPIYARLSSSLNDLELAGGLETIAVLPAAAVLGVCLSQFAQAERAISRERELAADRVGVEATGATAMAASLLKLALYSFAWLQVTASHLTRDKQSRVITERFGEAFKDASKNLFSQIAWRQVWPQLLAFMTPHPIDSHPPLRTRLKAIQVEVGDDDVSLVEPAEDGAVSLIQDAAEYDKRLTAEEKESLRFRSFAASRR